MDINTKTTSITDLEVAAIIVYTFNDNSRSKGPILTVDKALNSGINKLIQDGEIKGNYGEKTLIHTLGKMSPVRILVAGLGNHLELTTDKIRATTGDCLRYLRGIGVTSAAVTLEGEYLETLEPDMFAQAITEGALLGLYRMSKYKSSGDQQDDLTKFTILRASKIPESTIMDSITRGEIIAKAVNFARDMVNEPANVMTPTRMAELALVAASETNLKIEVLDEPIMQQLGMGALLGVAQGSVESPKLIVMRYAGDPSNEENNLGLLGKGITFDSGGLDLKPPSGMATMKQDMAGGAAVIAAMQAISLLKPCINVTGIIAATENMPGGKAQRPGDIVKTMSGKTIEIDNTDAEGRLVLADALSYARSLGLSKIVDVATLTGAIVIALGKHCTGAFGNDTKFTSKILSSGETVGERMWAFPMFEEYKDQYKSDFADLKNTGGRGAGSITGAQIIGEFADGASWVHLDIAGTALEDRNHGYNVKGATGVPVRSLINLSQALSSD